MLFCKKNIFRIYGFFLTDIIKQQICLLITYGKYTYCRNTKEMVPVGDEVFDIRILAVLLSPAL